MKFTETAKSDSVEDIKSSLTSGFTMVEVIIVAVIVGILAAIAIPLYNGYVTSTRQQSVDNIAQTAAASASSFFRKTNAHPDSADLHLFLPKPGDYTVNINAGTRTITVVNTKYGDHGTGIAQY